MTWEPRPIPKLFHDTERFWNATTENTFLLKSCNECDLTYFYPRPLCPDCLSSETEWIQASGTGSIYSYSVMEDVAGWPEEELPLINAYIELEEGPRVFSIIVDCLPEEIHIGDEVIAEFLPTHSEDIAIPVFTIPG